VAELLIAPERLTAAQVVDLSCHTYLRKMSEGVNPGCVKPDKKARPNRATISPRATVEANHYVAMRMRGFRPDSRKNGDPRVVATRMLRT
jgi:hypothetical protein